MNKEIWRPVAGYEGKYEVSNLGRVKSLSRKYARQEKMLTPSRTKKGYLLVRLSPSQTKAWVHRLVADAFLAKPEGATEVNHINNQRDCNTADNLEWVTHTENVSHRVTQGRCARGETHPNSQFGKDDVLWIREHYIPGDKQYGARAIAKKYGISHQSISQIINRETWKHI